MYGDHLSARSAVVGVALLNEVVPIHEGECALSEREFSVKNGELKDGNDVGGGENVKSNQRDLLRDHDFKLVAESEDPRERETKQRLVRYRRGASVRP